MSLNMSVTVYVLRTPEGYLLGDVEGKDCQDPQDAMMLVAESDAVGLADFLSEATGVEIVVEEFILSYP